MTGVFRPYKNYSERRTHSGEANIPWLTSLPEHWDIVRSKRLFATRKERARADDEQLSATQAYGVIPQKDFEGKVGRKVVRINQHLEKRAHVEPDDFVISMRSFQGGLERAWARGCIRSSYVVLNPSPLVHIGYFAHLFKSQDYISALQATSNFIRDGQDLNFSNFCLVDLPLPPQEEQDLIGRFLDWKSAQINKFIRNKRRLIELLKEQKQNVINQAVTQGLDPNVKFKPSGVEWIGDIPEHWDARRLRTLAAVRASGVDKNTNEDEVPVMLCNYVDVYKNDRITAAIDFMKATATPDEIRAFELKAGDVIITKDSESWDDIAIPTFVPEAISGVVCAYHLALIRPFSGEIEGEFLFRAFSSDPVADQFRIAASGVTRFGLAQGAIKGAFFPLPPLEEQRGIIAYINEKCAEISQAISRAEREIELMREYRTRLISDVVTGQVDVRGIAVMEIAEDEQLALDEDVVETDDVIDEEGDMDEGD